MNDLNTTNHDKLREAPVVKVLWLVAALGFAALLTQCLVDDNVTPVVGVSLATAIVLFSWILNRLNKFAGICIVPLVSMLILKDHITRPIVLATLMIPVSVYLFISAQRSEVNDS